MVWLIVLILLIILIVLIVSEIVLRYSDEHLRHYNHTFDLKPEHQNLKVDEIGIVRSSLSWYPFKSNVCCHTDIICRCGLDYIMIIEFANPHRLFTLKVNPINNEFKIKNWVYRITEMWEVKQNYVVSEVFNLRKLLLSIPYHMFSHNCHHVCQMVLDIITSRTIKNYDKHFEFTKSNFLPIIYIKSYLKDLIGFNVVETHTESKVTHTEPKATHTESKVTHTKSKHHKSKSHKKHIH